MRMACCYARCDWPICDCSLLPCCFDVAQQAETKDRRDGRPSRERHCSTRGGTTVSHATHEAPRRLSICVENTFICHDISQLGTFEKLILCDYEKSLTRLATRPVGSLQFFS